MDDQTLPTAVGADMAGTTTLAAVGGAPGTTSFICGRGRVGKTVFANTLIQFARSRGAKLEVWNSDRQNQTHSVGLFHPDALAPASDNGEDKRLWLERNIDRQSRERFDAVMDMAGGDPMIRQLAHDVRLVRSMERRGLRAVVWHILGPDPADLDYLRASIEGKMFMPEATLLVLNEGLVTSGRSVHAAFADVIGHPVMDSAIDQGAQTVWFPRLVCMQAVIDQGLTFDEAIRGVPKPGFESMTFTDETRVQVFWEDDVPKFFGEVRPEWLPAMPAWLR